MKSKIEKLSNGTIQLTITIPQTEVKKTRSEVVEQMLKNLELPGFRKGKAPKKMAEERLDEEKIREQILKKLLPETYLEAIKEHDVKPIMNPKIHVDKLEGDKDWQFTALTCEVPVVDLDSYKDNIKKITAKSKIVIPGKEPEQAKFEDIIKALLESVQIMIPEILVDQEVEKLLAQTLDDIKRLGLSLEQYLLSTARTPENLRGEYKIKAENDIKLEFTLQKIAEEEYISVEAKEIDEAIQKAKDENERKNLESNRYLLAAILRQQKTLDFLKNL